MKPLRACLVLAIALCTISAGYGGGSLPFEDIRPILEKDKKLGRWLLDTLEFGDAAGGTRLGHHWTHLSAYRQGPYDAYAKPKSGAGAAELNIRIVTDITYYAGKKKLWSGSSDGDIPVDRIADKATTFSETLASVEISAEKAGDQE